MSGRLIADHRVRPAVYALIFASALCLVMLVVRSIYIRHLELKFFMWNLLLAWLPLVFALRVYELTATRPPRWWPLAVSAVLWFLFFPNAPYLVTDFLHLKGHSLAPVWFDIVMMMSFAWTGLLLGYLSLGPAARVSLAPAHAGDGALPPGRMVGLDLRHHDARAGVLRHLPRAVRALE
jgi:hypothetical protein